MDGNRRWAKEKGLPSLEGHRAGYEKIKETLDWAQEKGIKEIIIYGFSTENWNRSAEEVKYLMKLIEVMLDDSVNDVMARDGRMQFIGQLERLPEKLQTKIAEVTERTKEGKNGTLVVALSYGGRAEFFQQ